MWLLATCLTRTARSATKVRERVEMAVRVRLWYQLINLDNRYRGGRGDWVNGLYSADVEPLHDNTQPYALQGRGFTDTRDQIDRDGQARV